MAPKKAPDGMVIGTGLVATSFAGYKAQHDFLVFASGVSNSKSCTPQDMKREEDLFMSVVNAHPSKHLVYFSTTSVNDPDLQNTPYIKHKLEMESIVRRETKHFHIFRLSNLAGRSNNPSTLLNFFYSHIWQDQPFVLWTRSERNIIDAADVYLAADHILQNNLFRNEVVNLANPSNYPIGYIVECMERHTGKKANFTGIDKGDGFTINTASVAPIYESLGIDFGLDYLPRLLEKYYPQR